ncbi:hypothetical protein [Aquipuribacter hungaricus]|uniref:hypothetical protein n=1 Tax=Aquipuribacter hungaricus TaxID=545624 RepID=UPI0030EC04CC
MPEDELSAYKSAAAVVAPGLAALVWLEATLSGSFETAWGGLDPVFRLAVVQEWISSNAEVLELVEVDRDDLARQLASAAPTHWLWHACGCRAVRRTVERLVEGQRGVRYGIGTRPRFVAPDLEVVVVFDLDGLPVDDRGRHVLPVGEGRQTYPLIMRLLEGRHVVRGVGMGLLQPGWPPPMKRSCAPRTDRS